MTTFYVLGQVTFGVFGHSWSRVIHQPISAHHSYLSTINRSAEMPKIRLR